MFIYNITGPPLPGWLAGKALWVLRGNRYYPLTMLMVSKWPERIRQWVY